MNKRRISFVTALLWLSLLVAACGGEPVWGPPGHPRPVPNVHELENLYVRLMRNITDGRSGGHLGSAQNAYSRAYRAERAQLPYRLKRVVPEDLYYVRWDNQMRLLETLWDELHNVRQGYMYGYNHEDTRIVANNRNGVTTRSYGRLIVYDPGGTPQDNVPVYVDTTWRWERDGGAPRWLIVNHKDPEQ